VISNAVLFMNQNTVLLILIIVAHVIGIALAVRRVRQHDRWARIPTLTDLNGPRLMRRMGRAIEREQRVKRHARLAAFLKLEGVRRRP
jgi:hypothetical protein